MNKGKIALGIGIGLVVSTGILLLLKKFRLSGFKKNLISNAKREWILWGKPLIVGGKVEETGEFECSPIYKDRVGEYWKKGTNKNIDGCDRSVPWSSAFISFVMKKSGAKDDFIYTSGHSKYIRPFISNAKAGRGKFRAYPLHKEKPQLGDLVCYTRESGVDYDTTRSYKSHCDIVTDVNKLNNTIEVIGGNVSDGVTKRILSINDRGYLDDKSNDWFTIIKNYK